MRPAVSARRAAINERAEYILNTYGDSILRYAYSYLHNMSDAEDILQDTLIQHLKTGPVFENAVFTGSQTENPLKNLDRFTHSP